MSSLPANKIAAAQTFLWSVKPWWRKYGEKFTLRDFVSRSVPDSKFGGFVFSDSDWSIYIDAEFAQKARVEEISAAIEREYYRQSRNLELRLSNMSPDAYEAFGKIAAEMEICSAMLEEESAMKTQFGSVSELVDSFPLSSLDESFYERWGIKDFPLLRRDTIWNPEDMKFPSGQTAESYFQLLYQGDSANGEEDEDDKESPGEEGEENTEGEETADNEGTAEQEESDDLEENEEQEQETGDAEGDDTEGSSSDSDDTESDQEGDQGEDDESPAEGQADGSDENNEEQGKDSENDVDDTESSNENNTDETNDESSEQGATADSLEDSGEVTEQVSTSGGNAQSQHDEEAAGDEEEAQTTQDKLDDLLESSERRWYSRDHAPPKFYDEARFDSDLFSDAQDESALEELSDDIRKYQDLSRQSSRPGFAPGNTQVDFADEILVNNTVSWSSIWSNMMSKAVDTVKIKGGADVSYEVRNPNQPRLGPIMMGLYDNAVKIGVIIDTSGSMEQFIGKTFGTFMSVILDAVADTGDGVVWATVDVGLVEAGVARDVDQVSLKSMMKGWGGTELGGVIEELSSGRLTHKGITFDSPDVVIILTDCLFSWPWPDASKPPVDSEILVASMLSIVEIEKRNTSLPYWVNDGENFVHIPNN